MGFYVDFTVKRGGVRQKGVELSFLYNGSKKNLTSDFTDKNGEVRTEWHDIWRDREVEIFFDGRNKHKIKLEPRGDHTITLPSGCFPYQTKIHTPLGLKCIGDMNTGDFVLSFDPASGLLTSKRVIKKLEHEPMRVVEVRTKEGKSLFVTESHRLLTKRGYVSVSKIESGDCLFIHGSSLPYNTVDQVAKIDRVEIVYNLVVADNFSFIADGFAAHSFTKFPKLQACFWTMCDWLGENSKASLWLTAKYDELFV